MSTHFQKWFDTFIEEKGIDTEKSLEVEGPSGTNFMSYGVVIDAIKDAPSNEQAAIKSKLVALDFRNAPIEPFLAHLAKAIAQ